ncbi:MAG: ribonuclease E/G [Alphaproteobacteria bacterium]|nr:ribonuclease E/G [Alphaproteobacteria bacterium]
MTNKLPNHFILIDKCAEETRIVEILNQKILKMSSWFDVNPSIVGNICEAKIIKTLHGGIVRARLKNDIIVSVRGVPKSNKVNSVVKIIIVSEQFDEKPIQANLLASNSQFEERLNSLDQIEKIIFLYFTKNIPVLEDKYAVIWDQLDLDQCFLEALQPSVNITDGRLVWIEKTKAATLIDIDTQKLILNSDEDMFAFCKKAYIRCLEEIKLRNIGGMILIDFPRMSSTKKKLLHKKIDEIGKKYFTDGKFLGFSKLLLYEIYIPRNLALLENFYENSDQFNVQNHLRSLWRVSKKNKSKNKIQFICGSNLFKKIINKNHPSFVKVIHRNDLPNDYGELSETN